MVQPKQGHWIATKHMPRYLKDTMHFGLRYVGDGELVLQGFSESNWVGSASDRKSTLLTPRLFGVRCIQFFL